MQITVGRLRELFADALAEAKIGASAAYLQKEAIREHMQQHLVGMVKSGEVTDQAGVEAWCDAADMSLKALKLVPFDVWARMAGTKPEKP
jgi:hypothetical protein